MNIRKFLIEIITTSCFACLLLSLAHAAPVSDGSQRAIYTEPLKTALAQDSFSDDHGSARRTEKVEKNAAALTEALIHGLNTRGVSAYSLHEQHPAPRSGWVFSGVLTENVPKGLIFSGLRAPGSSTPNTEVDVSICDLSSDPGKPGRLINTAASLGGEESALSLNPYEVGAKVVVHHVASNRSIADLARRIADQILAQ